MDGDQKLHCNLYVLGTGDALLDIHSAADCPAKQSVGGTSRGKNSVGSTESYRTAWDEYLARSSKANLN